MTLPEFLGSLSSSTGSLLRDARLAGFDMREETITELLLTLLSRLPNHLTRVRKLSTTQEHVLGPDFLWAIERQGVWLRLWCQAKKASGTQFLRYEELGGTDAAEQAMRLLMNAHREGAAPVYAFYNPSELIFEPATNVEIGGCLRGEVVACGEALPWNGHHAGTGCSRCGVTVADGLDVTAHAIASHDATARRAAAVNEYAMPWECLLCPAWATHHLPADPPDPTSPLLDASLRRALRYSALTPDLRPDGPSPTGCSLEPPAWIDVAEDLSEQDLLRQFGWLTVPSFLVVTRSRN